MPTITSLHIQNFRNITTTSINPAHQFNLFHGDNGSGKTSLLEAIYYLGLGKSFRTSQADRIIQQNTEQFRIVAKLAEDHAPIIGVERNINGERKIKFDGEKQLSIATVTKAVPIQFMSPMSYRFFHDGPKVRRQFLDWALFHVEPSFHSVWQELQRTLKQRNSALKSQYDLTAWNHSLVAIAEQVDRLRTDVFNAIKPICIKQLAILLPNFEFELRYQRGWSTDSSLQELLIKNLYRDKQLGYTYYGPQRADFQLLCQTTPIQDILSQGQQKLAAYALHLALGSLLHQVTNNSPIYLIDDLPSELDALNRSKINQALTALNAQAFITGILPHDLMQDLQPEQMNLFHVKHGVIA